MYLLHKAMMWLLSSWTNFLVTASSIICFTCTQKHRRAIVCYCARNHSHRLYLAVTAIIASRYRKSSSHHHYHSQVICISYTSVIKRLQISSKKHNTTPHDHYSNNLHCFQTNKCPFSSSLGQIVENSDCTGRKSKETSQCCPHCLTDK